MAKRPLTIRGGPDIETDNSGPACTAKPVPPESETAAPEMGSCPATAATKAAVPAAVPTAITNVSTDALPGMSIGGSETEATAFPPASSICANPLAVTVTAAPGTVTPPLLVTWTAICTA